MSTRRIFVTERQNRLIDKLIRSGRYANASEVACAGLQALANEEREHREKLKWLRNLRCKAVPFELKPIEVGPRKKKLRADS